MNIEKRKTYGMLFALFGASFWGIGGTASDVLFTNYQVNVDWYVTFRLIVSGLLLLSFKYLQKDSQEIFGIWKDKKMVLSLFIFSIFGMLLVQYSYMASIEAGNAAVATLLQYLAPLYIIFWMIIRGHQKLRFSDSIFIFLTLMGTFLMLTNGSFQDLTVSTSALIWGIISGLSLAFYTLYANKLLLFYSSITVVGWAMLLAGILMNFYHPIWQVSMTNWTSTTILVLLFTIIFGTALAFWMFIKSLEYITAKETTLFGTVEPLTAIISTVIIFNLILGVWQLIGITMIITLVVWISLRKDM